MLDLGRGVPSKSPEEKEKKPWKWPSREGDEEEEAGDVEGIYRGERGSGGVRTLER